MHEITDEAAEAIAAMERDFQRFQAGCIMLLLFLVSVCGIVSAAYWSAP